MKVRWPFPHTIVFTIVRYAVVIFIGGVILGLLNHGSLSLPWRAHRLVNNDVNPFDGSTPTYPDPPEEGPKDNKIILLWNPFFGEPDYGIGGFGSIAFNKTNCSSTCWTTNDHSYLPVASAVVIHAYNIGPKCQNLTLPQRAFKEQIFVFFILESPLRSYNGLLEVGDDIYDLFNLTFTFIDDPETDIYIPMGGIKKRPVPDEKHVLSWRKIKAKKYAVAWFVSNCNAPSNRMEYAQELSKHVDVHIYGQCGTYTCSPGDYKCFVNVMREYMFYLSFENSYCEGYATEKIFRTLKTEMIPIVYGGGNYSLLLHAKSYLDVRDFSYPKALAKYLSFLQRNPREYQEYFTWKRDYAILQEGDFKAMGFCKLCEILYTKNYPYKSNFDPVNYWNPYRWCLRDDDEMKAVHLL